MLYQFVYSIECIKHNFNLFQAMPRKLINMDSKDTILEATECCSVVVIEYTDDGAEFLMPLVCFHCTINCI